MAKSSIRIRAKMKGDVTEVKALMSHSMETGLRKDKKTGKKIPAHFIQEVNCDHNGKNVMVATMAFGKVWRNIITVLLTPRARAARMYSKFRARRNSARTTPTRAVQENRTIKINSEKNPG